MKVLIYTITSFMAVLHLCVFTPWYISKSCTEEVSVETITEVIPEIVSTPPLETEPHTETTDTTAEETEEVVTVEELTETETIAEETEPEEVFKSYYTYTEEELDLLSRLIFSEGGTESYETKLKIGSVVMNRVTADAYFPDTIREVIYQKNQFSVTTIKMNGVIMIDRPADEESKKAAKEILDYGSVLPPDVQVFYADWCKEEWVTSREVYGTFDGTTFAYIYPKK